MRLSNLWGFVLVAVCVVLLAYLFRRPLLISTAELLTVDDQPTQANLIYLLNGGLEDRPFHAAKLYRGGIAPRIVIPVEKKSLPVEMGLYAPSIEVTLSILETEQVPREQIVVLETLAGGVTSTWDEAEELRDHLLQNPADKILVVTTAFHTRRAKWIIERILNDAGLEVRVQMSPSKHWLFDEQNWWTVEQGLITYFQEYVKFALYIYRWEKQIWGID